MEGATLRQKIINELYERYQANGYITEDEALACFVAHKLPLNEIDSLTEHILTLGIIIKLNEDDIDEDDDIDRPQTNYESIFNEVLSISPGQASLINYIRNIRLPQHREWQNLMPQAKAGNKYAINRLFEMYLRVVVKIALNSYKNNGYELDDLIQEGSLGLLRAIQNYNLNKHGSFISYLPWWVMQYIDRAIADKSRNIRVPVHFLEQIKSVKRSIESLQGKSENKEPSFEEIANDINMTVNDIELILRTSEEPLSIHNIINYEYCDAFHIKFYAPDTESPYELYIEKELKNIIDSVLSMLTCQEENILRFRYGLFDGRIRTLEEVGNIYNITRERIRQIEAKALRKLRNSKNAKYIKDFY